MPPERASILIALMVLDYFSSGAFFPKGGSGALRDALVHAARGTDVVFKTNSEVDRINREADAMSVRTVTGETYTGSAVISNADPTLTLGQMVAPGLVPSKVRAKVERLRPSLGTFIAFLGTDLDLPALGLTTGNIHHYESLDINAVYRSLRLPILERRAPFCFITSTTVKDPDGGHAPDRRHSLALVTASTYDGLERWADLPSMDRGDDYESLKARVAQSMMRAAERYVPGLSEHIDAAEYASPLTNRSWVHAVQGGMVGPEHAPDQVGRGRFSSCSTGIDGLFLAGSGTIGGGVAACMASGLVAGREALTYLDRKAV
jgi:prolycopene isomerase